MRLPKIRQLTSAQKDVYLYAPTDRHVLVQGPPGTGKTLIACLRAIELQKKNVPLVLGMYNRVLVQYSSRTGDSGELPAKTVTGWFRDWWHASRLPIPRGAQKLYVEVDFEQKDDAKAAGARWQKNEWAPWRRRPGTWMVDPDLYFSDPAAFSSWRIWHAPPCHEGKSSSLDWDAIARHVFESAEEIEDEVLNVGSMLIDEGQDFPPAFYKTLRTISALGQSRGVPHPLRCFVLADENQQITEENSTLEEIVDSLQIAEKDRYTLLDNFRNSREIAELARHFFADVGVLPKVPDRSGPKPVYALAPSHAEVARRVRTWLTNNPKKEVGVLTFSEPARASLTASLTETLGKIRGRTITVQSYSWTSRQENRVDDLRFDEPDVVTVLNMQSCKGLEFDAVFIADLHEAKIGLNGPDRFRMQMFVAVSRGRDWVSLIDSGPQKRAGGFEQYLPGEEYLERETDVRPVASLRGNPLRETPKPVSGGVTSAVPEWEATVRKLAEAGRIKYDDRRASGGALWVSNGAGVEALLKPLGFLYAHQKSAWWKK